MSARLPGDEEFMRLMNKFGAASYRLGCVSVASADKIRFERDNARAALIAAWNRRADTGLVRGAKHRLLTNDDTIQRGDEVLADDTVSWVDLAGWEIGMRYHTAMQPVRRALPAPPAKEGR